MINSILYQSKRKYKNYRPFLNRSELNLYENYACKTLIKVFSILTCIVVTNVCTICLNGNDSV